MNRTLYIGMGLAILTASCVVEVPSGCKADTDCAEGLVCASYGQGTVPADAGSGPTDQTRHCLTTGEAYPPSAAPHP